VPQQQAWIVEYFGKFNCILEPGISVIIPFIQKVAYKHSLKEQVIDVHAQTAISNDNVSLTIDGVLYIRIADPKKASYGVNNPYYAISQLAQTTMRSEIGKIALDKTFEERETLNHLIVSSINQAAESWGIQAMRYEIKDIQPPESVLRAMELQVTAERQKRAKILESEGQRQAQINAAEGEKAEVVLGSEASKIDQINKAEGESSAIFQVAEANAKGIQVIANAIKQNGGEDAVAMKLAGDYIQALKGFAKENNTLIVPANIADPAGMIASATSIFKELTKKKAG
jgi:regulator of protease activity HflC (stomatin/prohibitin superfamily)